MPLAIGHGPSLGPGDAGGRERIPTRNAGTGGASWLPRLIADSMGLGRAPRAMPRKPRAMPWAGLLCPVDPDICLTAPVGAAEKNRARGFAPITKVYRIEAKTWPLGDTAGASAGRKPPAMFRQQDERSGCSSAEPYPLACQCRLSAWDCCRQAWSFFRRSSIARYSFTRGTPHPRA